MAVFGFPAVAARLDPLVGAGNIGVEETIRRRGASLMPDPEQDVRVAALLVKHGLMAEAGA